jgi:peptidoglycan/xylan/chitin deacetylase (PgdA/CDA1 family)
VKLTILMYHRVEEIPPDAVYPTNFVRPTQFNEQISALNGWGYRSITFDDWLAYREQTQPLPPRPLIITFDDGYRTVADDAWPTLRSHGFTATTFLVTGQIGGTNVWDPDERQDSLLSADEVRALRREGMHFGSHTRTHRPLTRLSAVEIREELERSLRDLEGLLGERVTTLAYPFNNQNRNVREAARRAGYTAAVRGTGHMNYGLTNPMALRRIKVDFRMSLGDLKRRLFRERWLHFWP